MLLGAHDVNLIQMVGEARIVRRPLGVSSGEEEDSFRAADSPDREGASRSATP
jgi:hypothetical protein